MKKTPIFPQTNADQSPQPIAVVDGQHCRKVDELHSCKAAAEVATLVVHQAIDGVSIGTCDVSIGIDGLGIGGVGPTDSMEKG